MAGTLSVEMAEFRSVREAYLASIRARPDLQKARYRWVPGIGLQTTAGNVNYRGTGIQFDPTLQDRVMSMIASAAPAVAEAFNRHYGRIAIDALKAWPVDTGLSKALVFLEYTQNDAGQFVASLGCRAPYAYYIQSPGSIALELIFRPGQAVADQVAAEIAGEIAR